MRWSREKFLATARTRTPDHPARSPALYHFLHKSDKIWAYHFNGALQKAKTEHDNVYLL